MNYIHLTSVFLGCAISMGGSSPSCRSITFFFIKFTCGKENLGYTSRFMTLSRVFFQEFTLDM